MPRYHYVCKDCEEEAAAIKGAALTAEELPEVMFETSHKMEPSPAELALARICPRCQGINTDKIFLNLNIGGYIRGYGYFDRNGCHRDMNHGKLSTGNDPYQEYRVPGEVDDIKAKLKRAGQHQPNTQYFVPTKAMENAVAKAVNKPPPKSST